MPSAFAARARTISRISTSTSRQRADRRHGRERVGKILAGLRHAVRRGPAPLCRDLLAVREPVPGSHGSPGGGCHRGHPARHRDRSNESGAHLPFDGGHDDRAQRSFEALVRARGGTALSGLRTARYAATPSKPSAGCSPNVRRARAIRGCSSPSRCRSQKFHEAEIKKLLAAQGYTRIHEQRAGVLQMIQDRFRWSAVEPARADDAIEAALKVGQGRLDVYPQQRGRLDRRALAVLDRAALPGLRHSLQGPEPEHVQLQFAHRRLRDLPRVRPKIGVDYGLVIPDAALSLREGAIKPWQTESYKECQTDLLKFARKRGMPRGYALARSHRGPARLGHRRRRRMDQERLVRRQALLRLARDQSI